MVNDDINKTLPVVNTFQFFLSTALVSRPSRPFINFQRLPVKKTASNLRFKRITLKPVV